MENTSFTKKFLYEVVKIAQELDYTKIDKIAEHLSKVRKNEGRVFLLVLEAVSPTVAML